MPSCCFRNHPTNGMVIAFPYLGAFSRGSPPAHPGRLHQNTWRRRLACLPFCPHATTIRGHMSRDLWATVFAHRTNVPWRALHIARLFRGEPTTLLHRMTFRDESCMHIARRFRGEPTPLHIARRFRDEPCMHMAWRSRGGPTSLHVARTFRDEASMHIARRSRAEPTPLHIAPTLRDELCLHIARRLRGELTPWHIARSLRDQP